MVEWGVCGEGKEWEGLCVGMPSIARAAAGNDANPRLQPATSQTDNEHDASLRRRIPPLAAILPCHRHLVNHPTAFPAVGRASPTAWPLASAGKNFSFPLAPATFPACPARPQSRPGKLRLDKHLRKACTPLAGSPPLPPPSGNISQSCRPNAWHPAGAAPLSTLPAASGILAPPALCRNETVRRI